MVMVKRIAPAILFLAAACAALSQERVAVLPFTGSDLVAQEELLIMENLIRAHIAELDSFVLVAESEPDGKGPDYVLSGSIRSAPEGRLLSLELRKTSGDERLSYSAAYRSLGDMALGARNIVDRAVAQAALGKAASGAVAPEELSEERVIGTWRGDRGIETVRLLRGGTGLAFFSSGVQMRLSYAIQDGILSVRQAGPNNERFYHPVPYRVARRLAEEARPMVWSFRLYEGGTLLRGIKTATAVTYEQDEILELIHESERDAEWTKITR